MAGWNFFNKGSQAEDDPIPAQQGGHRISQFTGQAVPAVALNLGAPPVPVQQQPQPLGDIPPAQPEPALNDDLTMGEPLANVAEEPATAPDADMTALYPSDNGDRMDSGDEAFFVAPPTENLTPAHTGADDNAYDTGMDLGLGDDLSLGEPLDMSVDTGQASIDEPTDTLPMVDLSTGSVVDEPDATQHHEGAELISLDDGPPVEITEPTAATSTEADPQDFLQDTDPPFDISHSDVGEAFDDIGQGATAQLLDTGIDGAETALTTDDFTDDTDNPFTADDDDFLSDATPVADPEGTTVDNADAAVWDDFNTTDTTTSNDGNDAFLDGFSESADTHEAQTADAVDGFDLGDDLSLNDSSFGETATPIDGADDGDDVWGLGTVTDDEHDENDDVTSIAIDLSTHDDTVVATTNTIELHNATYIETGEDVALSSEDMAAFYPQHHDLEDQGTPVSGVVLPPETPTPLPSISDDNSPVSHIADAPLDILDSFAPSDDDWALDDVADHDATLAPLSPEESSAIVSDALAANQPPPLADIAKKNQSDTFDATSTDETTPPIQGEWFEDDGFSLDDGADTALPTPPQTDETPDIAAFNDNDSPFADDSFALEPISTDSALNPPVAILDAASPPINEEDNESAPEALPTTLINNTDSPPLGDHPAESPPAVSAEEDDDLSSVAMTDTEAVETDITTEETLVDTLPDEAPPTLAEDTNTASESPIAEPIMAEPDAHQAPEAPTAAPTELFSRAINNTLTIALQTNPETPEQVTLWANNPSTGQHTQLKTLPLGLLPADTDRIRVSPEAQLKNKTIYRVDLVRWKGLFSQAEDGSVEFRDELYLSPTTPEPSHA